MKKFSLILILLILPGWNNCHAQTNEWEPRLTETWEPVPPIVTPGINNHPPSDVINMLDDNYLNHWQDIDKWNFKDGILTISPGTGGITTSRGFGDVQLHIEWRIPANVDGESQRRGNSGIFFQELYEVQILDSYNNHTYTNGQAGSVYKQHPPLVNAMLPPGEWQTYDIIFSAPVFTENGTLARPAYLTVFHNGIIIQNHIEVMGPTVFTGLPNYEQHAYKLPLYIQGSRHEISFRNIWIREL